MFNVQTPRQYSTFFFPKVYRLSHFSYNIIVAGNLFTESTFYYRVKDSKRFKARETPVFLNLFNPFFFHPEFFVYSLAIQVYERYNRGTWVPVPSSSSALQHFHFLKISKKNKKKF